MPAEIIFDDETFRVSAARHEYEPKGWIYRVENKHTSYILSDFLFLDARANDSTNPLLAILSHYNGVRPKVETPSLISADDCFKER